VIVQDHGVLGPLHMALQNLVEDAARPRWTIAAVKKAVGMLILSGLNDVPHLDHSSLRKDQRHEPIGRGGIGIRTRILWDEVIGVFVVGSVIHLCVGEVPIQVDVVPFTRRR
jgi:hypothetical protein